MTNTRITNENIHTRIAGRGGRKIGFRSHVDSDCIGPATRFTNPLDRRFTGFDPKFSDKHPGAGSGKGFSDALTDAGPGTRHQSGLAVETNHWRRWGSITQ